MNQSTVYFEFASCFIENRDEKKYLQIPTEMAKLKLIQARKKLFHNRSASGLSPGRGIIILVMLTACPADYMT